MAERAVAALSGGVDSSVAAALLVEAGLEVIGVSLRLWDCTDSQDVGSCCGLGSLESAAAVAEGLDIPHFIVDATGPFESEVLRHAWREYDLGRTPNPCVHCNDRLKFGLLMERADSLGARWVATGHHARLRGGIDEERPRELHRGHDRGKDQSYFLFALTAAQLERARFPVGDLTKTEVREFARKRGLPSAERAESQDACLGQGTGGFAEALRARFGETSRPGALVSTSGETLGEHAGIHRFTVGQRKGIGVALGERAFVQSIDAARSAVVITTEVGDLSARGLEAGGVHWFPGVAPGARLDCLVQIRYRTPEVPATVEVLDGQRVRVLFESPLRAITPGQALVMYRDSRVLGGGWIERSLPA